MKEEKKLKKIKKNLKNFFFQKNSFKKFLKSKESIFK